MSKRITQANLPKIVFYTLIGLQLILMLAMSFDAGISGDEFRHHTQAEKVYNYFATNGKDRSALEKTGVDPMQYNGQSFDNLMYAFEKWFNVDDYMTMRHFFNALFGWLIILMTGLIAKELWGYNGAILAVFLLFISPRFIGHALNNNKDIPFAFGFIFSFYWMMVFIKQLPKPKNSTLIYLTLGIGIAISIRLAGILSIAFLGFFSAIYAFSKAPIKSPFNSEKLNLTKRLLIYIPLVSVIGYLLGILFWPYMLTDPIAHFKTILHAMSEHPVSLSQLFEGKVYNSDQLPRDYTLIYILYTYPLIILLGLVVFTIQFAIKPKGKDLFNQFIILFSFYFVVIWMNLENSNIYGGIRHLLFIYPLAIVATVIGVKFISEKLEKLQKPAFKYISIAVLFLLAFNPVKHILTNYPYSYVYFNELAGGTAHAAKNFESDYFQHSLRRSTEWLVNHELKKDVSNDSTKVKIVTNSNNNVNYFLKPVQNKVSLEYTRFYDKSRKDWKYAVLYCDYVAPNQLKHKLWPPKGTIHVEEVDGFPISAVVKRISDEDYKGFEALRKNKLQEAKNHFKNYLKLDPKNVTVLAGIATVYDKQDSIKEAIAYADSSLQYNPRQISAIFAKTSSYVKSGKFQEALELSNYLIGIKNSIPPAHFFKGVALKELKRTNEALKEFQTAIKFKKDYYQAYMMIGDILINFGKYQDAISKFYEKVLQFKKNDVVATTKIALCYHFLKNDQKAEEILQKYIAPQHQNNFEVVKLRARMALAQKNMRGVYHYLIMARNINNNSDLDVIRSMYMLEAHNQRSARDFITRALKEDPTNREAMALQKRLQPLANNSQTSKRRQNQQSIMFQKNAPKRNSNNLLNTH
ncbi:MAG TPA: tetratricopeptide repeat protein [Sunxiuqinia sp.]|nr:tetratricopeptide repeat protein [Sunxiuqinia sp.]